MARNSPGDLEDQAGAKVGQEFHHAEMLDRGGEGRRNEWLVVY